MVKHRAQRIKRFIQQKGGVFYAGATADQGPGLQKELFGRSKKGTGKRRTLQKKGKKRRSERTTVLTNGLGGNYLNKKNRRRKWCTSSRIDRPREEKRARRKPTPGRRGPKTGTVTKGDGKRRQKAWLKQRRTGLNGELREKEVGASLLPARGFNNL